MTEVELSISSRPTGTFPPREPLTADGQSREGLQATLVDQVAIDQGLQEPMAAYDPSHEGS